MLRALAKAQSARTWRPLTRAPLYSARRLLPARGSVDVTAAIGFGWQQPGYTPCTRFSPSRVINNSGRSVRWLS